MKEIGLMMPPLPLIGIPKFSLPLFKINYVMLILKALNL